MKKFLAFTLAETLIVMGVIGIVSALTLPNLNSSTGDKEKVAKVKKIYQNLTDAVGRAEAVYGPIDEWFINDTTDEAKAKRAGERITEFMKVSKNCETATGGGCFNIGKYKMISGGDYKEVDTSTFYKIITADNTSVAIGSDSWIVIDIDGPAKGNFTLGHDIFCFVLFANLGVLPLGNDVSFNELLADISSRGTQASSWIIKYDNADYLKFRSVSGSIAECKNGNTVTESHPTCK